MTFDATIHLGDVLVALGFALGGWRIGVAFRDQIRALHQTVYGSVEPPVFGLVGRMRRVEKRTGIDPGESNEREARISV